MPQLNIPIQRLTGQRELGGALHQLGQQLVTAGRFDEARQSLELSLDLFPGQAECHFDLANILYAAGRLDEAIAEYQRAVGFDARLSPAWYNMGVALMQSGRLEDAEHAYRRALRFGPNNPETHNNLGILLQSTGRGREAITHYKTAAALRPGFEEPRFNLGSLLHDLGRLEEARQVFEALLADCPDHTEASNNLANVLSELGRHSDAKARFEQVLAINPEHNLSRWNLGLNQLRTGDWREGWRNYEARFLERSKGGGRSAQPLWDGRPLEGARLLLTAEQGMGDLLQAVRFISSAASLGARIVIECHPPLIDLFERMADVETVVCVGMELPPHDCWLPMMSLPFALGVTLDSLRSDVPYLEPDPVRVEYWRYKLREWKGLRAGFAWSGNPKFRVNSKRSLTSSDVRQVSKLVRQGEGTPVHLFSLQKGVPAPTGARLIPLDDDPTSMGELAAVMMNLDLVLTVDTSVAHLAGALGRPVWTMLAFHADWRWMTAERAESPWYPTMRLFRQTRQGDWSNVLDEVETKLTALRAAPEPSTPYCAPTCCAPN